MTAQGKEHEAPARFNLVVCTVGRPKELRGLLESLTRQTYRDFAVIVVDQSRGNLIAELVTKFKSQFPIQHIRDNGRGLSRARNIGLRFVTATVVAFPDDDCTYPERLLEGIDALFEAHSEVDSICVTARDERGRPVLRFDRISGPVTRYNVFRRYIEFAHFTRTSALQDMRFDETLGVGAGTPWGSDEGADFVIRLLEQGVRHHYFPDLVVHHAVPGRTDSQAIQKCYRYACGRGRLLHKHRFPLWYVAYTIARTAGGLCLSLLLLRPMKALFYLARIRGVLRGYLSRVPFSPVTSTARQRREPQNIEQ